MACSSISVKSRRFQLHILFRIRRNPVGHTGQFPDGSGKRTHIITESLWRTGIQIDMDCVLDIEGDIYDMTEDGGER